MWGRPGCPRSISKRGQNGIMTSRSLRRRRPPQNRVWPGRARSDDDARSGTSRYIPRPFDLLALPRRPILLRKLRIFVILPSSFKRIHIAECAGVRKVEFDDIIAVVQRRAGVWPQGRFRMERHERTGGGRGTDAGNGRGSNAGSGYNGSWSVYHYGRSRFEWSRYSRSRRCSAW